MKILFYIFLAINGYAFFLMGWDKRKARKNKWRTRERKFFILAFLGGALGIYAGMKFFHHKTLHNSFRYGIPILILINLLFGKFLYSYFS